MNVHARIVLLALLGSAAPVHAQWSATPHQPGNVVIAEGFLVAHDDGQDLRVVSAVAEEFRSIAPSGATVHGSGDWTLLVEDPTSGFVAYSARHHALAPMPAPSLLPQVVRVEDDVALVIGNAPGGALFAHAYSANTNSWDTLAIGSFADVVASHFVAAFREGPLLHGFAARTGTWATFFGDLTQNAKAEGNVVTYERVVPGDRRLLAFSGVLGVWSPSPRLAPTTQTLVDHNVALGFAQVGAGAAAGTGYSAYTARWLTSPQALAPSQFTNAWIEDNVVLIERAQGLEFEALGARPQLAWSLINDPGLSFVGIGASAALLTTQNDDLAAFSGLFGGSWERRGYVSPVSFTTVSGGLAAAHDGQDEVHAFSAARSTWAAPLTVVSPTFRVGEALLIAVTSTDRHAYSVRYNAWTAAPPKLPILSYTAALGESVFVSQAAGALIKTALFFNEREHVWQDGFDTWTHPVDWHAGRNLLVADATGDPLAAGPLYGYSVQRNELVPSPASLVAPLTIAPTVEDNVAWAVDSGGTLHVFRAPGDVHAWYAWPNGSEYQVFSPPAASTSNRTTLAGPPGGSAWLLYALAPNFTGLSVPPLGGLLLVGSPLLFIHPVGPLSPLGLTDHTVPLPPAGPRGFQVWTQGLTLDPVTGAAELTGPLPETTWFF